MKGKCMKQNLSYRLILKDLLLMTVACTIIAAAVFFFLVPSHAAVSSISGLAIVLQHFVPLSISQLTMIMNGILLIVGYAVFGKEFGFKTAYTSIILPLILGLFELLFPHYTSLTGDATLDVVAYCIVVSVGCSILFNDNASSGGLDVVAKLLNKYFHIELGKAMTAAGVIIALSSALAYDSKTVVLSLLGTYFNGIILDYFIFGQTIKKRVCIVSQNHCEEIRQFIIREISGATLYEAVGAYNLEKHTEIIAIVTKHEFRRLMDFVMKIDPKAFVTVYNVNEIHYQPKPKF